mgnify:CR=1 FL=1
MYWTYIFSTYLLDLVPPTTLVLNDPAAIDIIALAAAESQFHAEIYAKEIDDGERERAKNRMSSAPVGKAPTEKTVLSGKEQHNARRLVRNLEKTIAKLDDEKKELSAQMLGTADADAALKLHNQIESIQKKLAETENTWYDLQVELGEFWILWRSIPARDHYIAAPAFPA